MRGGTGGASWTHALEPVHEVLDAGVQARAVDAVDGVPGRVRSLQCCSEPVEDGEGALADAPVQHLVGALFVEHAATGHHEEGHVCVVDAGDDAHLLLLAQAAFHRLLAALARRSGSGALAVALVAVAEVRLVNLNTVAGHGVERGVVALDTLDDVHGALVHAVAQ